MREKEKAEGSHSGLNSISLFKSFESCLSFRVDSYLTRVQFLTLSELLHHSIIISITFMVQKISFPWFMFYLILIFSTCAFKFHSSSPTISTSHQFPPNVLEHLCQRTFYTFGYLMTDLLSWCLNLQYFCKVN